jgi:V-type H+-transporting ATPase subunit d
MVGWLASSAELAGFNAKAGFLEAAVRGHRAGLLTAADYGALAQCESLEDVRLFLSGTDYAPFVADLPAPLRTGALAAAAARKLVADWAYLRANAGEPLGKFLDYCTYGHMIDNVVLVVSGALAERDVAELLDKCHPLGAFDALPALAVATSMRDLYRLVLVDTPLAPYFAEHLTAEDLDEMGVEVLRGTLYKAYLEDFAAFCERLGGTTAEVMAGALGFEADRRALNVALNAAGTELTRDDRRRLFPALGALYPEGHEALAAAEDFDAVRAAAGRAPELAPLFGTPGFGGPSAGASTSAAALAGGEAGALDRALYEEEARRAASAFSQQFHFGIFHAYRSLREQEARNVLWVAECVAQGQRARVMDGVVLLF